MRRNGDNLLILSGNRVRRAQSAPVQIGDMVRAAMSEVENYQRVQLGRHAERRIERCGRDRHRASARRTAGQSLRASPPEVQGVFTSRVPSTAGCC